MVGQSALIRRAVPSLFPVLMAIAAGCAPEITRITPTQIRPDGIVVVEGKRMSDKLAVSIGGGPIPVSAIEITQEKDKIGRFSFRMPTHDAGGAPLMPGSHEASIRVGGTTERVQLELSAPSSVPRPTVSQVSVRVTTNGGGLLKLAAGELRWPLMIRVAPIVPHGEEFGFSRSELSFDQKASIDIALPVGAMQLSSYRVYVRNSVRYGGRWSEVTVAVYKP